MTLWGGMTEELQSARLRTGLRLPRRRTKNSPDEHALFLPGPLRCSLPDVAHSQSQSEDVLEEDESCSCKGREDWGEGGAAGSSTVHEGFPFLFSKICTRERSMLITCAQQAMMIYCERHEAEIKESQSEISQSGIEYVGELFTESVYKVDETSPREAELRSSPVCF